ncbi:MAG: regulatory protein RecX [Candidatus Gracilibacteria bacterium]|jgi:regulatory protein|nr:regulatory protein RecX [Candidatus Gracilibacteria bacterium]
MIDINLENSYAKAITYCLGISIKKRYTEFSMREKLKKFLEKLSLDASISKEIEKRVLSRLKELNYINDKDFVRDYFLEKSRLKAKGKFKIIMELKAKKIDPAIISEVVSSIDFDESEILNTLFQKQVEKLKNFPKNKQKEKLFRFLLQRGFGQESIYNLLNNHYSNTNDKD